MVLTGALGRTGLDDAVPKVSCLEAVTVRSPCSTQDSWLSLLRHHLHQLLAEHCHRDCRERTGVSTAGGPGVTCRPPALTSPFTLGMMNTGNWNQLDLGASDTTFSGSILSGHHV